jgi:hypothetical protein
MALVVGAVVEFVRKAHIELYGFNATVTGIKVAVSRDAGPKTTTVELLTATGVALTWPSLLVYRDTYPADVAA